MIKLLTGAVSSMNYLFDLLAEPMFIVESDGNRWYIRDANQAFTTLSGFSKKDLRQLEAASIVSTEAAGLTFNEALHKLSDEANAAPALECKLTTKLTSSAAIRLACRKLPAEERMQYVLICHDLRESKWIEQYITQSKIMISCVLNEQYSILSLEHYDAPVAHPAFSYVNKPFMNLVADHERSQLKLALDRIRSARKPENLTLQIRLGERSYRTEAVIQPFYNGNRSFKSHVVAFQHMHMNQPEEDSSYKLRMLMLSKNMSVTSLAQSTLISLTTISKIRNGKIKKPQRLTAELIAGELGVLPETIWSSYRR
jgi:DNA-binding Xre family transcriptional regulator